MGHVYLQTIKTQCLDELLGDGSETHGAHFSLNCAWASEIKGKELGCSIWELGTSEQLKDQHMFP